MNRVAITLIFSLLLSGCFPIPWKKQYFESVHPSFGSWHTPKQTEELRPYFVADRYFHMIAPAINGTSNSGGSPFYLIGSIGNRDKNIESAKIVSIAVKINDEIYTQYQVTKCAGLIDRRNEDELMETPFLLLASDYSRGGVSFCVSPIHVDFGKVKTLEVTTEIAVSTTNKTEARKVIHKFKPTEKSGLFTWAEV